MDKEILTKQSTLAAFVCVGLILLAVVTHMSSSSFMESAAINMLAPFETVDSIQKQIIENSLSDLDPKMSILKKQFLISGEIKSFYLSVGVAYYKNYYTFSICSILFITLLTIAGFLIANKGWQNSSLILKSFLLTTIVFSSVYYFLPEVLNNKENLNDNIKKVVEYEKIQSDILTIANRIEQMDSIQIDSSITYNYERISSHLDFLTKIDDSQLQNEFADILKQFKQNN